MNNIYETLKEVGTTHALWLADEIDRCEDNINKARTAYIEDNNDSLQYSLAISKLVQTYKIATHYLDDLKGN